MSENYYKNLEVEESSTQEDIKKAYRLLAIKFHPDKNDAPDAGVLFHKINKAYETLSDPEKKALYDSSIRKEPSQKGSNKYQGNGADLRFSIKVNITDLIRGNKKVVPIKRKGRCSACEGTGSFNKKIKKCDYCSGTGLQGLALILGQKKKCTYCDGVGHRPVEKACTTCRGSGLVSELIRHEITLNPFSYVITAPGMGNYPIGSGKPGDLTIELEIEQNPLYKIKGLNIYGTVWISPAQAVLGGTVTLNVFDKLTEISIPPGAQHNTTIEQEDGGITYEDKTGVFKAVVKIIMPDIITEEEKDLYKQILSLEKGETSWPKVLSF